VHTQFRRSPFSITQGPLPGGWHAGRKGALAYYWNDSGAKQLHMPSAPYLSAIHTQTNGFDDVRMEKAIGGSLDRGADLMDQVNSVHNEGGRGEGKIIEDTSPQAMKDSIGKEIASKSGFTARGPQ
jgi:hypothetical protein